MGNELEGKRDAEAQPPWMFKVPAQRNGTEAVPYRRGAESIALHKTMNIHMCIITEAVAWFQENNFILGQKSLRRKDLNAILITFKNRPHFGSRAGIAENGDT
jgi:hypothetical protein